MSSNPVLGFEQKRFYSNR